MLNVITEIKTNKIKLNVIVFDAPMDKAIKENTKVKNNCFFVSSRRNTQKQNTTNDKKKVLNSN